MPRVVGIDPGTVSIDLCGLHDGRVFLDSSVPTAEAVADPAAFVSLLHDAAPLDLVVGPSGYGLPLTAAGDLTDADLRLAFLAGPGERGGIGGLRSLVQALARASLPVVLTPGVIHLVSVPAHRKVNRIDMGTADKVCAAALAVHEQAARCRCSVHDVDLILLELGGAFTAAIAVQGGQIVDGIGGSSGPPGVKAAGALDAEVAFLAGTVSKRTVFEGGAATIAGTPDATAETIASPDTPAGRTAWLALLEGAAKAVAALGVSAPRTADVVLSGRLAGMSGVRDALAERLAGVMADTPVRELTGFAAVAKHAAQGAALIADGLCGGTSVGLVARLGMREARGTAFDHLYVISPAAARARIGGGF